MKVLFKEFVRAFSIGALVFIVIGIIGYFNGVTIKNGNELMVKFLYNQVYATVYYMANYFFFMYMLKRFKETFFKFENLIRVFAGIIGITFLCTVILHYIQEVIIEGETLKEFIAGESSINYLITVIISLIINSIFFLIYYYRHTQETKVKEQKIIAGTASAKFDALKNQLDPHFLFNSLNVLTSLIEENTEAATKFTTSLSKVYRYVLEQKNKDLVSVEEELQFAQLYMSLINMRFEDSIVFSSPGQLSNPEAKVVPLSLQLLLENAVKHNIVTPSKKLHISIFEEDGFLMVKNNLQEKQVVKPSTGVGLHNIKQRYYLLSDRPVKIHKTDQEFTIAIPLLTQNITVMETQENYMDNLKYERAKEHVENLKGFYIHFTIYLLMVPFFIFLNVRSTDFPWAIFPIFGWGFGVAGHAMETFNYNPILGKDWEERKMKQFMEEDNFENYNS